MTRHALTIDVEDWYQVENLRGTVPPERWSSMTSRLDANMDRLLELLERRGVQATCFVLGTAAERHPEVVRRIAAAGHEIASHGWSHDLIYRQAPDLFREETRRSRALLQELSDQPVEGYRASTFSITDRSLWALEILAEEGFGYDSSIAPLRHDRYGIPDAHRWPFRLQLPGGALLDEFPVTRGRLLCLEVPLGGGFFRLLPGAWARAALARAARHDTPGMLYLHPWEIDPDQPRVEGLGRLARFRHYVNLDKTYAKLDRLLGEHEWCTLGDYFRQERDRLPVHGRVTRGEAS